MPIATTDPNALDALKRFLTPNAEAFEANTPLALASLRDNRANETSDKVNNLRGAVGLGSPTQQRMTAAELQRQLGIGADVQRDQAADPYTGTEPQQALLARDQAINSAKIAATPEVRDETDRAQRAKLSLAGEPNRVSGQSAIEVERMKTEAAANLEHERQDQVQRVISGSGGEFKPSINWEGKVSFAPNPLNSQEQAMTDSAHAISDLGVPLLQKYEAKYPGIAQDPKKYGSPISDTLTEKLGKGIYSFGGMTDNDDLLQDSAAIQAWGVRSLASGRITKPLMDMISAHLPQPGFSPGSNYDRLHRLLTDILPAQLSGISKGRSGQPLQAPTDPYSDPNYQPR